MMRGILPILVAIFLLNASAMAQGRQASRFFSVVGDYPLGASVNRTDYESIDPAARRLYISKMGGGQLLVFDIAHNALVKRLDGFPKVTGVLAVPALGKVYASIPGSGVMASFQIGLGMAGFSKGDGEVAVVDMQTLTEIARAPAGVFPDGLTYDPRENKIFVSDELGSAVTVIDARTDKFVTRIETGGEVGNVRYDAASGNVYVPVQSCNELIEVDSVSSEVRARYELTGCDHPHGFIVAPNGGIGYASCDGNDELITVALATGRLLNVQPVAHDPDVLAVDPGDNRLYVASESGNLSIYDIANPKAPSPVGEAFVAAQAHAVAVDPISHRLYFALADMDGHAVLRVLAPLGQR